MGLDIGSATNQSPAKVEELGGNINNMGFKLNGPDDKPKGVGLGALIERFSGGSKELFAALGKFVVRPIIIGNSNIAAPNTLAPRDHGKPVDGGGSTTTTQTSGKDTDDPKQAFDDMMKKSGITSQQLAAAGIDMSKISTTDKRRILRTANDSGALLKMLKDATASATPATPAAGPAPAPAAPPSP